MSCSLTSVGAGDLLAEPYHSGEPTNLGRCLGMPRIGRSSMLYCIHQGYIRAVVIGTYRMRGRRGVPCSTRFKR